MAATEKVDVMQRFEMAMNMHTGMNPDMHLEGLMATIRSYRDFITENIAGAGGVDGPTFVAWMESATRDPDGFPEPWVANVIETFDAILIDVVRDDNVPPAVAVDALDEWVEQSTEDIKRIHDLPEGFFDV